MPRQTDRGDCVTRPDNEYRRSYKDGHSKLTIELDPDGRVFFAVDDVQRAGFGVSVSPKVAAEIVAFLRGGR